MFRSWAIALLLPGVCLAQENSVRIEEIVHSYVASKQFMGSVLDEQNGKVLFYKSYGFANLEWDIPNAPSTKFRVSSVTKQFTAASILLLEDRGRFKTYYPLKK